MAVLVECRCHRKQSVRNKVCKCGENLDRLKKAKRTRYWIAFRLPGGKQRKEFVGYSIQEARDADGKRKVQKRENRIFDMLPESNMTFDELAEWYLDLASVKKLATYGRVRGCIANFNETFANRAVASLKLSELKSYQFKREEEGMAAATVDMELTIVKTMVTAAFDDDLIDGRSLKPFRKIKRKLKKGANARKRTLSLEEYLMLTEGKHTVKYKIRSKTKEEEKPNSPPHLKPIIITGYHTGMRRGELLGLQWSHIDRDNGFIRLPAELTKEKKPKSIPLNKYVRETLDALPRHLHHGYVFTYKKRPILKLRRSFESACKNTGIPYGRKTENGITLHDLRGTFKSNLRRAGVGRIERDTILGHSLQGMDVHYQDVTDEDLQTAMSKYTAWFDAQLASVAQRGMEG
jgi:integrase